MSDIPADQPLADMNGAAQPKGFWRRLAQTLDAYFAERSKRAVPAITLRRSQHELARCRRLMHRSRRARRNYSQRPSGGRDAHLTIKWQAAYSTGFLCVAFALSQMAIGWLSINLNGRGRPAGPSIFRVGLIVACLATRSGSFSSHAMGRTLDSAQGRGAYGRHFLFKESALRFAERSSALHSRQSKRRHKRTTRGHSKWYSIIVSAEH